MRITEKELKEKIKIFENEDVILKFDVLIQGQLEFNKININYNRKTRYLHIADTTNNNKLKINIASVYEINLECANLQILLDDDIDIMIMKK